MTIFFIDNRCRFQLVNRIWTCISDPWNQISGTCSDLAILKNNVCRFSDVDSICVGTVAGARDEHFRYTNRITPRNHKIHLLAVLDSKTFHFHWGTRIYGKCLQGNELIILILKIQLLPVDGKLCMSLSTSSLFHESKLGKTISVD